MELVPIKVADGVCDHMYVNVIFILMYRNQSLKPVKPLVCKPDTEIKRLLWGDLLVLMKRNDVMGIHTT